MIHEQVFRDVMAGVCAPVTVVTARSEHRAHGATVSAFGSLSLRPPMVTVALQRGSTILARILQDGRFGVNVLGRHQAPLALDFAVRSPDRFAGIEWGWDHGLPRLAEAPHWIVCELEQAVEGGDHLLLLGAVTHVQTTTAAPLVYGYRTFGTHSGFTERPTRAITEHVAALAR